MVTRLSLGFAARQIIHGRRREQQAPAIAPAARQVVTMCWIGCSMSAESRYVDRTWTQRQREVVGAMYNPSVPSTHTISSSPPHPACVSTVAKHVTAESRSAGGCSRPAR
jgi:hypothetical protein